MDSLSGFADGGDAGGDSSDGGDDDETEADSEADDFDEELWDAIESDDEDAGGGGAAPLVCIEIGKFTPAMEDFPPCDVSDQAACLCEGCVDDGVCFNAAAELVDDCVCPDCADDPFCSMPDNCVTDGQCNPYVENCACADCAGHPECL